MATAVREADVVLILVSSDYNEALGGHSGPGEGVRFEIETALRERNLRPGFQVIPVLLDPAIRRRRHLTA